MTDSSIHFTTCPLCEATCGLEIQVRSGTVARASGDQQDSFSQGFICPKGASIGQLHHDPDRLSSPLVREPGGELREVSWAEAFEHVERSFFPARGKHRDSAAVYLGNPNVHSVAGTLLPREVLRALGSRNVFSATTLDQMPKHVACGLMYGDPAAIPVPDLDRTDYLLMLGANPWASNGSLCTAPDFPGRIKRLLARGGRCVVVDPKRTRTADHASEHIPIRPGSDPFFLLAIAQVLFEEGLVRVGRLAPLLSGLEEVSVFVKSFTPEAVARRTGVPADTVRRVARELAERERPVVYGRLGTHTVPFGTVAAWAVDLVNVLSSASSTLPAGRCGLDRLTRRHAPPRHREAAVVSLPSVVGRAGFEAIRRRWASSRWRRSATRSRHRAMDRCACW
jgi:anaerobic selenocysteine-containing dehydrogenase